MTVREYIEELKKLPQEAKVLSRQNGEEAIRPLYTEFRWPMADSLSQPIPAVIVG